MFSYNIIDRYDISRGRLDVHASSELPVHLETVLLSSCIDGGTKGLSTSVSFDTTGALMSI